MSFLLADKKKSFISIVISAKADRVTRFAAREMNSYLKKICAADFEISEEVNCPLNAVFLTKSEKRDLSCFEDKDSDAFEIRADENGVNIQGSNGRSVLYGVYDFLESLGCSFIEPGKEIIPETARLEVADMKKKSTAAFDLRNVFRIQIVKSRNAEFDGLEPEHHLPQIDWMAKQRLNHYVFYVDYYRYDLWEKYKYQILDALQDRGFKIEVTHHSILYFCPPNENCDFGNYGSSTYQINHPDWYIPSLLYGCEYQARVELPEVQEIIKERFLEYLRNNPELDIVGLWPGDSSMNQPYPELSHTDGYLKFWNNISEAVKKEFPDKKLCTLAYFELTPPPEKIKPNTNLHSWFCRHDDNYFYPISDEKNKKYFDLLKEWVQKMAPEQIACFHYYGWMPALIPFTENMKLDLNVYKEMDIAGVYGWSGFTYNVMGNDYRWAKDLYVFSRLLWNPEQDLDCLEETWAKGVFANSAPEILEFYNALKQAHKKESKKGLLARESWISLDLLHNLQEILDRARSKTENPQILNRINLLEQVAAAGSSAAIHRNPLSGIERAF